MEEMRKETRNVHVDAVWVEWDGEGKKTHKELLTVVLSHNR